MTQTDILQTTQKERDSMTPARLSLILGVATGTMYKAFQKVGTGTWGLNIQLSEDDVTALILYYAGLGNETAIKLAETRRNESGKPGKEAGASTETARNENEPSGKAPERTAKPSRWYYLGDVVFAGVTGIVAYEMWFFLGFWGLLFWGVYAGALFFCLVMAKDSRATGTAQYGYTAVVLLECIAFFSHLSMANHLVIKSAKAGQLPFLYNEFIGSMTAPFYISCALAAVLSSVPVFLLWARMSITKEVLSAKKHGN